MKYINYIYNKIIKIIKYKFNKLCLNNMYFFVYIYLILNLNIILKLINIYINQNILIQIKYILFSNIIF